MKHSLLLAFSTSLGLVGVGCGDDGAPPPPELAERETPAAFAPPRAPTDFDAGMAADVDNFAEAPPCCEVRFALRDFDGLENEASAHLRGPDAPLRDAEIPLVFEGGNWSASVCLPVGASHRYFFEFGLTPDSGEGVFLEQRANPNATLVEDGVFGAINEVALIESCDDDFSEHEDTSPADDA